MTYAALLAELQKCTPEQLEQDVTIECNGEYFHAQLGVAVDDEILDPDHLVIAPHN